MGAVGERLCEALTELRIALHTVARMEEPEDLGERLAAAEECVRHALGCHVAESAMAATAAECEREERAEIRGMLVQADHALHGALQLIGGQPAVMLDGPEVRGSRTELRGEH